MINKNRLMWDERSIPPGCVCDIAAQMETGVILLINSDCPVHGKYLKAWKPGMCNIVNRSTNYVEEKNR